MERNCDICGEALPERCRITQKRHAGACADEHKYRYNKARHDLPEQEDLSHLIPVRVLDKRWQLMGGPAIYGTYDLDD